MAKNWLEFSIFPPCVQRSLTGESQSKQYIQPPQAVTVILGVERLLPTRVGQWERAHRFFIGFQLLLMN